MGEMGDPEESFFKDLPELADFAEAVSTRHHRQVPDTWHVVITDVRGSTTAIEAGRYKDVNALGVASIIAIRNALPDVEIPYVFGGDGATLLVPGSRIVAVETALRGIRAIAEEAFALKLRASHVPIARLSTFGHPLLVGRFRMSPHVVLAALSGRGVSVAEDWVKGKELGDQFAVSEEGPSKADLEGFECRWQPAQSRRGKIVSLLVVAVGPALEAREATYRHVLTGLSRIVGQQERHPLSLQKLRMQPMGGDFSIEARVISGHMDGSEFRGAQKKASRLSLFGRALMRFGMSAGSFDGTKYMAEFLQNTDFQKFDEALRMVLDLTDDEVELLDQFLKAQNLERLLAYGMHLSDAALITCMVKSYSGDHVHFVDGSDGGYALAAKQLKLQLKALVH